VRKFLCALGFAIVACDSPPTSAPVPPSPSVGVPSVSISPTGRTIAVGDSLRFSACTNVSGTTGFTWSVSAQATASVSPLGWVRALTSGPVAVVACVVPNMAVCGNATLTIQ
jgi:Big-like domain-containing protein